MRWSYGAEPRGGARQRAARGDESCKTEAMTSGVDDYDIDDDRNRVDVKALTGISRSRNRRMTRAIST